MLKNLLLFVFAFTAALVWNEINFYHLSKEKPEKIRQHATVLTSDDASYLSPALHFYASGVWKDNNPGRQSYFLRPPGYGAFYLIFVYLFGSAVALVAMKYVQLFLFALSAVLLYRLSSFFIQKKWLRSLLFLLYAVSPFGSGFLYYSLTEAITPALVIAYFYCLFSGRYAASDTIKYSCYFSAALLMCFTLLVRPVLGLLGMSFFVVIVAEKWHFKKKIIALVLYGFLALVGLLAWEIRNYTIAKEYVGLHPIYYPEANNLFRLPHKAICDYYKCWNIPNEKFHLMMGEIWENAMQGDTSFEHLRTALVLLPPDAEKLSGKDRIVEAFKQYQASILEQKKYYDLHKPMPSHVLPTEEAVMRAFEDFRSQYAAAYPFRYYVVVPLKNYLRLSLHSNLSMHILQHTYRGKFWTETMRYFFYALHSAVYLFLPLFFLFFIKDRKAIALTCGAVVYVVLLAAYFKDWEERYTLPVLAVAMLFFFYGTERLSDAIRRKL